MRTIPGPIESLSLDSTAPRSALNRSADNGAEVPDQGAVGPGGNKTNATGTRNRYVKAAVTLGALVVAVNICVLPFILYVIIVSFFCPQCSNGFIRDILANILYMNSCLNPILYAATMSKIRRFYKSLFCQRN